MGEGVPPVLVMVCEFAPTKFTMPVPPANVMTELALMVMFDAKALIRLNAGKSTPVDVLEKVTGPLKVSPAPFARSICAVLAFVMTVVPLNVFPPLLLLVVAPVLVIEASPLKVPPSKYTCGDWNVTLP